MRKSIITDFFIEYGSAVFISQYAQTWKQREEDDLSLY